MIIWTHRGNPGVENTLEGFKQAWGAGIRHFETDIHLTKDGVIVLSHDPDTSRLSTSSQLINELTFDELQQFPVEGSHSWARLEDLIDAFPEAHISIDLKCDEVVIPFTEFAKGKNYSRWVVGSFSTSRVQHIRNHFPDLLTADINLISRYLSGQSIRRMNCASSQKSVWTGSFLTYFHIY